MDKSESLHYMHRSNSIGNAKVAPALRSLDSSPINCDRISESKMATEEKKTSPEETLTGHCTSMDTQSRSPVDVVGMNIDMGFVGREKLGASDWAAVSGSTTMESMERELSPNEEQK